MPPKFLCFFEVMIETGLASITRNLGTSNSSMKKSEHHEAEISLGLQWDLVSKCQGVHKKPVY